MDLAVHSSPLLTAVDKLLVFQPLVTVFGLLQARIFVHRYREARPLSSWKRNTNLTFFSRTLMFAALAMSVGTSSWAVTLVGSNVTGALNFGGGSTNYFDPAVGSVPAGTLNTAGTTVTVSSSAIEFGYADPLNRITANFGDLSLQLTDVLSASGNNFSQKFTFLDNAFIGLTLVPGTNNYPDPAFTSSLVGNTLTISLPAQSLLGRTTYEANFTFAATPEPGSCLLFGTALLGLAPLLRRRFRPSAS